MDKIQALKNIGYTFTVVATGVLIATTIFCSIFYAHETVGTNLLREMLFVSALCTLTSIVFSSKKEPTKKQMLIRHILHLFLLTGILFFCAYQFEWIKRGSITQPIVFLLMIPTVYLFVVLFSFKRERQIAEKLNDGLRKYNNQQDNN